MVAETKETVSRMFGCMNDSLRAVVDAGQRTQESWLKASGEAWKRPAEFERLYNRGERIAREWVPFVGKTMDAATQSYDAGFRAGMDAFKTVCDVASKTDDADPYRRTRQLWDAAFDAARTNFDAFAKASARTLENCTAFCESVCSDDVAMRAAGKPSKLGA
jgi:hypothetical protein